MINILLTLMLNCFTVGMPSDLQLVFHITQINIKQFEKISDSEICFYNIMAVKKNNNEYFLGLIARNNIRLNDIKFYWIKQNGKILSEFNIPQNIDKLTGDDYLIRNNQGKIYFSGNLEKAYLLNDTCMTEVDNFWNKKNINSKYPNCKLNYIKGVLSEYPFFYLNGSDIFNIEFDGQCQVYTNGILTKKQKIKIPAEFVNGENDLWEDPIITIKNNKIFFWYRSDKIEYFDINKNELLNISLEKLFVKYKVGKIKRIAEMAGIGKYADDETFYLIIYADNGIFIFKYIDDEK